MKTAAALVAALLIGTPVAAQDITAKLAELAPNSKLVLKSGTSHYTHVFLGRGADGFDHKVVSGSDPDGPLTLFTYVRDEAGQLIASENRDGRRTTYTPHNCQRTLGTCRFSQETDGVTREMERNTVRTASGIAYEQSEIKGDERILLFTGEETHDSLGMVETSSRRLESGRTRSFTRVSASWDQ